ncbi:MAG: Sec-independent protein translocase protein TatB [Campylobacteraceae bacterium]|nr:Sec-independent protein translocase protein TatB [Campylobacteraceae bacterium]
MFGIGFFEFIVIAVVIIIFLGPDKLPETLMKVVKTFKAFNKTINEAKSAIEKEINIEELKEDSKKYRALLENNAKEITKSFSLEELKELKESAAEVNSAIDELRLEKIAEDKTAKSEDDKSPQDKEAK